MNAKANTSVKETKETKQTKKTTAVSPEYVVKQLNEDVRNSVLVVSVLVNLFFLIGWLVIEVSNRYDAALINWLQHK
jgi:hypothetical protein